MAIYVDSARHPFKGHIMCHMTADSLYELHEMAIHVRMKRDWFQTPPKASFPHYDIPERRRELAIRYGAIEVDDRTSLYFAARLGMEWARMEGEELLLMRYSMTLRRAVNYVPPSLLSLAG